MLEISDLGLSTWKRFLMEPFKETLVRLVISEIEKDRNSTAEYQAVLQNVIMSFVDVEKVQSENIKYYEETIESQYLL